MVSELTASKSIETDEAWMDEFLLLEDGQVLNVWCVYAKRKKQPTAFRQPPPSSAMSAYKLQRSFYILEGQLQT